MRAQHSHQADIVATDVATVAFQKRVAAQRAVLQGVRATIGEAVRRQRLQVERLEGAFETDHLFHLDLLYAHLPQV